MSRSITSEDGRAVLQVQNDGNLVLYHPNGPVWSSHTDSLTPIPEPDLIPITLGNWHGNFMYDEGWYFGPSLLAWPKTMRQEYYRWTRLNGYTHLWVNAQQDNWDGRYTRGGYNVYANGRLEHLLDVLKEIRAAQLIPCLGLHDQPQAKELSWEELLERQQWLVDETWKHVALYMGLTWELNELDRWGTGEPRNEAIVLYCGRMNFHGRDVLFHYAPPALGNTDEDGEEDLVFGGYQLWELLPSHAVRGQQIPKEANDQQLRERTYAAMIVNRDTGTKICAFEHSRMSVPGREVDPSWTLEDSHRRAGICLEVLSEMPKERRGGFCD